MSVNRPQLDPALLAGVADIMRERTGLVFSGSRSAALDVGVAKSLARAGNPEPERYLARLAREQPLLDDLVTELTVKETYFFREPEQLRFVRRVIVPELVERKAADARLRIWSAATASGEEAYSLAIIARELGLSKRTDVLGTDICTAALAKAKRGAYGRWSLRGVSDDIVARYFVRRGLTFEIAPEIRAAVEFRQMNLVAERRTTGDAGTQQMDLILCRNVLIYFDPETVAAVARRLVRSLADGGWLIVGGSDPLLHDLDGVEVVITDGGLAYRRVGHDVRRASGTRRVSPDAAVTHVARFEPTPAATDPLSDDSGVSRDAAESARATDPGALAPAFVAAPVPAAEAITRYAARDYARAAELAAHVVSDRPEDVAHWVLLVRALANDGRLADAGRACAQAIDRHPTVVELVYLHAILLDAAGRSVEAAAAAARALYLDRRFIVAHLALGSALLRVGDRAGAKRAFRNAEALLRAKPGNEPVDGSDNELAGSLLSVARSQLDLLERS